MSWIGIAATIIVVIVVCLIVGFKDSLKAFFAPDKGESLKERGTKTITAAALYSAYHYWVAMPVAIGLVTILNSFGLTYWEIFSIMWILNAVNGFLVLRVNDHSEKDITLSEGSRRIVDATTNKSNLTGIFFEICLLAKLTLWDGPAELTIFLRPRMKNHNVLATIVFLVAAGLQMLLWTAVYIKGYDSLSQLF